MPATQQTRPVIDRADAAITLVAEATAQNAEDAHALAETLLAEWATAPWPAGLLSVSFFVSTQTSSVLTYAQWSSRETLTAALDDPSAAANAVPDATPYVLYRRVLGGAVPDPAPPAECFPAATFAMADPDAARAWIDGLLAAEEANEGENREYPGALAANFHINPDTGEIFLLSEWASDAEAAAHIDEVIAPLLAQLGTPDPGTRYRHAATLDAD